MTTESAALGLLGGLPAAAGSAVIVYCDDTSGERTELSAAALGGWAARTTGLLRTGCGLSPGDSAAVALPPHWQTAAILLGSWAAGLSVRLHLWATAGLSSPDSGDGPTSADDLGGAGSRHAEAADVSFVSAARLRSWLDTPPAARHRFALGLEPYPPRRQLGADTLPEGYRDYLTEALRFTDALPSAGPLTSANPATTDGTTYRQWGGLAAELASRLGLRPGDRLLVDTSEYEHPVQWLLAPLAAGASVVLCAGLDRSRLDARIAAEGVTHVL